MAPLPIFVINLDRRPDRMREMEKRLEGIAFSRISATDGRELRLTEDQKAKYAFLTLGEFACVQSHLRALRKVAQEGLSHACVLEDDVFLGKDFKSFVESTDWIPPHAGLVKIETMGTKVWTDKSHVAARTRKLSRLRSNHSGTAGYVVSCAFAGRLARMLEDPTAAADDVMFGAIEVDDTYEVLQLCPALCIQESILSGETAGSDIASERKTLRDHNAVKTTGMEKIAREIARPFLQLAGMRRKLLQRRMSVPFQ